MNFTLLADHWMKIKESEKIDKYLNLAEELKKNKKKKTKLWNIKVTVTLTVSG